MTGGSGSGGGAGGGHSGAHDTPISLEVTHGVGFGDWFSSYEAIAAKEQHQQQPAGTAATGAAGAGAANSHAQSSWLPGQQQQHHHDASDGARAALLPSYHKKGVSPKGVAATTTTANSTGADSTYGMSAAVGAHPARVLVASVVVVVMGGGAMLLACGISPVAVVMEAQEPHAMALVLTLAGMAVAAAVVLLQGGVSRRGGGAPPPPVLAGAAAYGLGVVGTLHACVTGGTPAAVMLFGAVQAVPVAWYCVNTVPGLRPAVTACARLARHTLWPCVRRVGAAVLRLAGQ